MCLLALIILFPFAGHAATNEPRLDKQSRVKDWSGPDISLSLQNQGKRTAAEKALAECKAGAGSMLREKRYNDAAREFQRCLEADQNDFQANLGLGLSLVGLHRYDEAITTLQKAQRLNPEDFDANFWLGLSLARTRLFKEALPCLERASELRPDNSLARRELFVCYLGSGQTEKAFHLYPRFVRIVGIVLAAVYCAWLALLLPFSLPIRKPEFPGFWFSLGWLALLMGGQAAFLLLLGLLPGVHTRETVFTASCLACLPIIVIAFTGFARQSWGEPFRWPLRLGTPKIISNSLVFLFLTFSSTAGSAQLYTQVTHKPFPLQRAIPLIQNALEADPIIAWLGIAMVIPIAEEIVFRGLLFGAFQKWWGITGAILGSAFVFACFHLQIIGFIHLFFVGLILGWARWQTRSLGLPIVIHSLNNAIALVALTFLPRN